jgi:outer membrane receptor for ferrienterochelin and colicins
LSSQLQLLQQQGLLQPGANITPYLNNPDLKPETSFGSHVGATFTNKKWSGEISLFRNDIRNLIDPFTLPFGKSNGQAIFSYHNVSKVFTQGFTIDLKYQLMKSISLSAGYQFLDAKDKEVLREIKEGVLYKRDLNTYATTVVKKSDYFGLFNRSRHTANFKINFNNQKTGWNVYARVIYRGKFGFADLNGNNIADAAAEMVKGYWMVNIAASKTFNENFTIQAGTENLLNYTNPVQLSNIAGRLFFLNLNYSFVNNQNKHKNKEQ